MQYLVGLLAIREMLERIRLLVRGYDNSIFLLDVGDIFNFDHFLFVCFFFKKKNERKKI